MSDPVGRPLAGRSALVTGASRGIGRATADALAAAGARVLRVARTVRGDDALVCDVQNAAQVDATIAEARARLGGPPDLVVNNAGAFALAPLEATSPDDFAATLDANLVAPFRFVHGFLAAMRERGSGHIVTVGSIADRAAFPENGAYAASKFGVRGLHEVLREELRGSGVRATLVSPGPVDTTLWDAIDPDTRPGFTPRARMLRPEDVAAAILYAVTAPARVNVDELRLTPA